jgi:signal transduction histidine kinase
VFVFAFACLSFLATAATPIPVGSDFQIEHWETKDGLPQNTITSVAQTPDGYLWFGTFNGLARFDGVRFTVFHPANTPALGGGRILELNVDREGVLWVLTEDLRVARRAGLSFEGVNGRLQLPDVPISVAALDPEGVLWLREERAEQWHRQSQGKFEPAFALPGLSREQLPGVAMRSTRSAWLRVDGQWRPLSVTHVERLLDSPARQAPRLVQRYGQQGIWAIDDRVAASLDGSARREFTPPLQVGADTTTFVEDAAGNIWVGTWGAGLFHVSPSGNVQRIPLHTSAQREASNERIRNVFIDAEENVWVSTDTSGLLRLSPAVFRTFHLKDGLRNTIVKSVFEDQSQRLWVIHGSGADSMGAGDRMTVELTADGLWTGTCSTDGSVWLGMFSGSLRQQVGGDFVERVQPPGLHGVMALTPRPAGGIWIGAHAGLAHTQGTNLIPEPLPAGLPTSDVRSIADDGLGTLYVGLNGGGLLRRTEGTWKRYSRTNGLLDDHVFALLAQTNGVVWVGTAYGGLSRFQDGRFFNYDPAEFPLPTLVSGLMDDGLGNLWIASTAGIFRAKVADLNAAATGGPRVVAARRFGTEAGLRTGECAASMQPTLCRAHDGRLWFATIDGLSVVDPSRLTPNKRPPPVVIQEILIDDRPLQDPLAPITVPSGNHRLLIHYAGLSYVAPERVLFKYKLEGFDPDWVNVGTRRTAYFQALPPGHYQFRVAACNEDGLWNEAGASLAFEVLPAYWQTGWFQALALAGIAAGIAAAYRVRVRRLRELARVRLRIASDLHDEVGGNLGSIAINCELLQSSPTLGPEDRQELALVNRVAVQTAQAVRDIVWFINPDFDNSADMLARMRDTAGVMLAGREFDFDGQGSGTFALSLEFRRHAFSLYKEALHNIVKHSQASQVTIRAAVTSKELTLSIEDNGRGFDPAKASDGHGMKGMRWRAAELRAALSLRSEPGKGTRLTLVAPLS